MMREAMKFSQLLNASGIRPRLLRGDPEIAAVVLQPFPEDVIGGQDAFRGGPFKKLKGEDIILVRRRLANIEKGIVLKAAGRGDQQG